MIPTDTDRGQVGIGTLIVFIAMVLVAAIAAGVLINTAGLLQSQAEATGQEASEQITDRVDVQTIIGDTEEADGADAGDQGDISTLRLTVRKTPGAGDIDMSNALVEVFAKGESATLTHGDTEDGVDDWDEEFASDEISSDDDITLSDTNDRLELTVSLSEALGESLDEGDAVTVQVSTGSGGTAFVEKRAPSSIDEDNHESFLL